MGHSQRVPSGADIHEAHVLDARAIVSFPVGRCIRETNTIFFVVRDGRLYLFKTAIFPVLRDSFTVSRPC